MFKNKQKGFTLIELLVVIGIIGLLASIIVVNLAGARKRARDTKRTADIRSLQTSFEEYYNRNANYPTSISSLVSSGIIPLWPTDPLSPVDTVCSANSDSCYWYSYFTPLGSAGPQSYHIGASLEEKTSLVLSQDRDCNSTTGASCTFNSSYINGFNGGDTAGCGGAVNKACYDLSQ